MYQFVFDRLPWWCVANPRLQCLEQDWTKTILLFGLGRGRRRRLEVDRRAVCDCQWTVGQVTERLRGQTDREGRHHSGTSVQSPVTSSVGARQGRVVTFQPESLGHRASAESSPRILTTRACPSAGGCVTGPNGLWACARGAGMRCGCVRSGCGKLVPCRERTVGVTAWRPAGSGARPPHQAQLKGMARAEVAGVTARGRAHVTGAS